MDASVLNVGCGYVVFDGLTDVIRPFAGQTLTEDIISPAVRALSTDFLVTVSAKDPVRVSVYSPTVALARRIKREEWWKRSPHAVLNTAFAGIPVPRLLTSGTPDTPTQPTTPASAPSTAPPNDQTMAPVLGHQTIHPCSLPPPPPPPLPTNPQPAAYATPDSSSTNTPASSPQQSPTPPQQPNPTPIPPPNPLQPPAPAPLSTPAPAQAAASAASSSGVDAAGPAVRNKRGREGDADDG
ncbi:hypothetical protein HDV00_012480 [Rhizophlyctis rosea]|nr:hypothetical protein HDV00_012480 [Rhizophlyctis rosea]